MTSLRSVLMLLMIGLAYFACSCGGAAPVTTEAGTVTESLAAVELPLLPAGDAERVTTNFDGAPVPGHPAFHSVNGTPDGSSLVLESGAEAWNRIAFAIYQVPEFAGDPHDIISCDVQYLDPDPLDYRPEEGYWVGYGDYAQDNWVFDGPYTTYKTRLNVPEGAEISSPGDNFYIIILACQENTVRVDGIEVGGYDGMGYEEYQLARPPGHNVGQRCILQLGSDGEPQIAYFNQPYTLNDHTAAVRIARRAGGEWIHEDMDLGYDVAWFNFALGDNNQRALVARPEGETELWLYYDDGSGTWSSFLVDDPIDTSTQAGLAFINSTGDPLLDHDMLIIGYGQQAPGQDINTTYKTFDGLVLGAAADMYGSMTRKVGRINLTPTADKGIMVGLLDYDGSDWYAYTGFWDFVGATFSFPGGLDNGPLDIEPEADDYGCPDVYTFKVPTSDYICGYALSNRMHVRLARYDGTNWLTESKDILPYGGTENYLDLDAFGSGRTVLLGIYSEFEPMLMWGLSGSGETYGMQYMEGGLFAALHSSIAVDGENNVHIALANPGRSELTYVVRPPSGEPTTEIADNGGMDFGGSAYYPMPVCVDDSLHVFYVNSTHPGILHSENKNGVWIKENEVATNQGVPYIVSGAGYLEDSNLVYACYLDYLEMTLKVVFAEPGSSDWQVRTIMPTFAEMSFCDDDGTNIAACTYMPSLLEQSALTFVIGDPLTGEFTSEAITYNRDYAQSFYDISHNPVDGSWGYASYLDEFNRVAYFRRVAPGDWQGPFTVAENLDSGGEMQLRGLTYNQETGEARVLTLQQKGGDPEIKIVVHSAPLGGTSFTPLAKVKGMDTATDMIYHALLADGPDPEPVVMVVYKANVDTYWDYDLYMTDGPGSWALHQTWDRDFMQPSIWPAAMSDGQPMVAVIETSHDSPEYGGVFVYWPW